MTTYSMEFVNNSDNWWHFGAYQNFPEASGLDGVIWQEQGLPNDGARAIIHWKMEYSVAIIRYRIQRNAEALQVVSAELGNTYEVVTRKGINGIASAPTATNGPPDTICLKNNTSPANPISVGFTLNGSVIAAQKDLGGMQSANYEVHTEYWAALFGDVQLGDLVSLSISTSPVAVQYPEGKTHAKITAYMKSGKTLTKVEYFPKAETAKLNSV